MATSGNSWLGPLDLCPHSQLGRRGMGEERQEAAALAVWMNPGEGRLTLPASGRRDSLQGTLLWVPVATK